MLCNEANIYNEDDEYRVDGDPTEGALLVSGIKGGLQVNDEETKYPQLGIVPFESERGFMATLHDMAGKKMVFVFVGPDKNIHFYM